MSFSTALLWEQRLRGGYPVSSFSLQDGGELLLALPRPLEPRTHDLFLLPEQGSPVKQGSISVETLLKLDVAPLTGRCLGRTSDSFYLFRNGEKARFLPEKRFLTQDASLSRNGMQFVAAYSNVAGSAFGLAMGDIQGNLLWAIDLDYVPLCVAVSGNGLFAAEGSEDGRVALRDVHGREVWRFGLEAPVCALACTEEAEATVYATRGGEIGLIDSQGKRIWSAFPGGTAHLLAVTANADRAAAVLCSEEHDVQQNLVLLDETGQYETHLQCEEAVTGIALSPGGGYLAVSRRGGLVSMLKLQAGRQQTPALQNEQVEVRVQELLAQSDRGGALLLLRRHLQQHPADVENAMQCMQIYEQYVQSALSTARIMLEAGSPQAALNLLQEAFAAEPESPQLAAALQEARTAWAQKCLALAESAADLREQEQLLLQALQAQDACLQARVQLKQNRLRQAEEADAEAARLEQMQDWSGALAMLEHAQHAAPTQARAEKLAALQVSQLYALAMEAYEAGSYGDALFQLKKVLQRSPNHAAAVRYAAFAQQMLQSQAGQEDALTQRFQFLE